MITRIAQVSDAHLSPTRSFFADNFSVVAEAVRAAKPDLMLVTGDLSLDGADSDADLGHAVAQHAAIGREWLCIPGNHDVGDEPVLGGRQPGMSCTQDEGPASRAQRCSRAGLAGWLLARMGSSPTS